VPAAVFFVNSIVVLAILVLVVRIILLNIVVLVGRERLHPALRTVTDYLFEVTEPVLAPIRRVLPDFGLNIDFSPLVAIVVIDLIGRFLAYVLLRVM